MKNYKLIIGIDVSKSKLDVYLLTGLTENDYKKHFIIENTVKGFKQLSREIKRLDVAKEKCLFCMEHTGIYAMPLCYWLKEQMMDYCLVPALEIKRSVGIKRGKNDKADAFSIAKFAYLRKDELECFELPEKELQQLKVLMAQRERLVKAIKMFKRSKEIQEFLPKEIVKQAVSSSNKTLKYLTKQKEEIEKIVLQIIETNPTFKTTIELAKSVPGVGDQTAITLMLTSKCFTGFTTWRKMACHAGIAPFEYSSGSSVQGKTKVNPMANKKIKSLLSLAALNAKKVDGQLRLYYERKVEEGKNPMSVMNAIRCKVLSRVYATVKRGTPYVELANYAA